MSPPAPPPFLLVTAHTILFNARSDHWLDVAEFDRLLDWDASPGRRPVDLPALRAAVRLYRSPFLEGFSLDDSPLFAFH